MIPKSARILIFFAIRSSIAQSLSCNTANGDNCTSGSICPNTVVNYTCTIISGTNLGLTDWVMPTGTCPTNPFPDMIRLSQLSSSFCSAQGIGENPRLCGPYRAYKIPPPDCFSCLLSILTVNITSAMNGNTVKCYNTNRFDASITNLVSMAIINITDPPKDPIATVNIIDPDMLLVTVNSSTSGGLPTMYRVTISSNNNVNQNISEIRTDSSGFAMVNFTGLTNDSYYNVSVEAINCAGSSEATTQQISFIAPRQLTTTFNATALSSLAILLNATVTAPRQLTTPFNATEAEVLLCAAVASISSAVSCVVSFVLGFFAAIIIGRCTHRTHNKSTGNKYLVCEPIYSDCKSMEAIPANKNEAYGVVSPTKE